MNVAILKPGNPRHKCRATNTKMEPKDQYYRRNLPHFHPEGYPLFITFRLANSIPDEILSKLKQEREYELKKLSTNSSVERYRVKIKHFYRYDNWLDRCANGHRWLEQTEVAHIVSEKIHSMSGERYRLLCDCIMPNHVHLLIMPLAMDYLRHHGKTAKYPITDTLRLLKGSTARFCNEALKRN